MQRNKLHIGGSNGNSHRLTEDGFVLLILKDGKPGEAMPMPDGSMGNRDGMVAIVDHLCVGHAQNEHFFWDLTKNSSI